ncbi:hypothetical protein PHLGIDRAFT_297439 [Phlebiopsis gigantea 11061_1 CR5-6]|uniref:Uncharacterized protein n=1 Tax=Phlebiopsis gigantea (strain 11061_1 CR5-6) TaxID=745531 RepID=A0A0C3S0D7_PHLG1|nr:hypothetical protein PHLGIDRAFT_297439 [Phlebiopsis gigantea 11061_1 CR5-6]
MAEVENIVPTSDPAEAEDDANNSDDLKSKEDASDVQSTGNRELSQEVPFTEEVYAAKDDDERTREDADHGEENEEPAAAGSSEVETDFEPDFEQLVPDSAGLRSRSDSREDPTDPIQPAEGLALALDRASNDPIEFDPPVVESDNEEVELPVPSPRPGTAKRMKDRNGRVPASDVIPALSSQPRLARQPRSARNSSNASADDATSGSTPESHEELVSNSATEPRRSTRQASVQPPPAEALPPAPAPKRRGRPPASAEEKARKAAEKEAEKQRRAAEREAKKQKATEDKARKAAAKGKNAPAKKGAVAAKTVSADTILAEASEAVATPPPPPTTAVPNQSALSVAKWTSLAETAQTQDAEMSSMVDELRSSSPELASPNIPPAGVATKGRNVEPIDVSMEQGDEDEKDSDDESPTVKASSGARPLFIPGDSQHPLADSRSYLLSSPQMPSQPSQSQSQDRFKRPLAPVTSWAKQSKYRRLSDIKSQDMFSPLSKLPVPGRRPQTAQTAQTAEERRASMYGDVGADSNSEDDSDSDDENASHIPKNRRAGVHKKELFVE